MTLPKPPGFVKKQREGNVTYEVYSAVNAEKARAFLLCQKVDEPGYHILVETPDGNWGTDNQGMYLESLRDWQVNLGAADCAAASTRPLSNEALARAAAGAADNFISILRCGACGHEWFDGVGYQQVTLTQCPSCFKFNSVDTRRISVKREDAT